ncbi:hypothetical protein KGP36_02400 [Patescibacteria group bacterium]|nr:hypothetical protein [Patescibacteria group bacterium]
MPKKPEPVRPASTALVPWDEELASAAQSAAAMQQSSGGAQFFSTRSGILSFDGAPFEDNQMATVVVAERLENVYYGGEYDENNKTSPLCFAFGTDPATMAPHQVCVDAGTAQAESCKVCPHNQWGTAAKGKGKACRNTQRLALIPAGDMAADGRVELTDPETMREAAIAYLKLPVTSVKGWGAYVRQLNATLHRPPYAVVTRVKLTPHPKNQFQVLFSTVEKLAEEYRDTVTQRHNEAEELIEFPYQPWSEPVEAAEPAPAPEPRRGNLPVQRATPPPAPTPAPRPVARPAAPVAAPRPVARPALPAKKGPSKY